MSVLFFDIDNTLLSHKTFTIPESARKGLLLAKKRGHQLFLCSGRFVKGLDEYYDPELFDGLVASSGAVGVYHQEIVYSHFLDEEDVRTILSATEKYQIGLFIHCLNGSLMNLYGYERLRQILQRYEASMKGIGMRRLNGFPEEPAVKMDVFYAKDSPLKEFLAEMPEGVEAVTHMNPNKDDYGSELTRKGVNKGSGIQETLRYLNAAPEDSYGFGDSANDIPMIQTCGTGIAMGNAEPCVKDAADHVTSDIEEDGIWNALKHFELI